MSAQISLITLGVKDLGRAKQFYLEGLGCPIQRDEGGFVSFDLGEGSSALALYALEALADDAGVPAGGSGFRAFTLNYVVPSAERVDEVMAAVASAGGEIVRAAQGAQWGGYFGYFGDPDGHLWKVAAPPSA